MYYKYEYNTPDEFSDLIMRFENGALTDLSFKTSNDEYESDIICREIKNDSCPEEIKDAFNQIINWLDLYFSGIKPDFMPLIRIRDVSEFDREVIDQLLEIPYGKTITYGEIANKIAHERGQKKMAAQAVGGAVGRNPISIVIPCHRVVGVNSKLIGYGGGVANKLRLLQLEGNDEFSI